MPWILLFALILLGLFTNNDLLKNVLIVGAIVYMGFLIYWVYQRSRSNIFRIALENDQLIINVEIKTQKKIVQIPINELTFRTVDKSKYSLREIQFLRNKELKLRQYVNEKWSDNDIDRLEIILKEHGIKKPFGENL